MSMRKGKKQQKSETQCVELRRKYYKKGSLAGVIITKGELPNLTLVKLIPGQ
ncbi:MULTISPECIES: hypothetical protein [Enterobacteriaceae]|uniref:hypothetical protein n=1 Tax=Enterobacteriaceae TaxID=543 RepID=UPI0021D21931|nr:hypothetical protein [Citrobacter cronae]MCU6182667.1 hypothetical protein [Citrobacter cronae]